MIEDTEDEAITPELLLKAYRAGIFPMAESRTSKKLYWFMPEERALLPIDNLHVPRTLRKKILKFPYQITFNNCFTKVINNCANVRETTWINEDIIEVYGKLHEMGHAHSVETWYEGNLVGGLYGVAIGGAFFGESMFSIMRDASKISLVYLVARLKKMGFNMLDAQFVNEHLLQFGVYEVPQKEYLSLLDIAVARDVDFNYQSSSSISEVSSCVGEGVAVSGEAFTSSPFLADSSGASSEKDSSDLDVLSFLHSIIQTS